MGKLDNKEAVKAEPGPIEPGQLVVQDDSAVAIHVSGPATWELEQLNLAISNVNDASAVVEKLGDLLTSLEGFQQQLASPVATPRQAALLQSEAATVKSELERTAANPVLSPFGQLEIPRASAALPSSHQLTHARAASSEIRKNIDQKRSHLNKELARLETAHLNSESSHTEIRDIESALTVVHQTREALLRKPSHAVDACGALGARARSLLLAE